MSTFSIIVAMDVNQIIGDKNRMPWHLPNDLKYFKKVTSNHTVVMGRKTFESIGKPLPLRNNMILTNQLNYTAEQCEIAHSIEDIVQLTKGEEEVFIIGGAEIYRLFFPIVSKLYITRIHHSFEGTTKFPFIIDDSWLLLSKESGKLDQNNNYNHTFEIYRRV